MYNFSLRDKGFCLFTILGFKVEREIILGISKKGCKVCMYRKLK